MFKVIGFDGKVLAYIVCDGWYNAYQEYSIIGHPMDIKIVEECLTDI